MAATTDLDPATGPGTGVMAEPSAPVDEAELKRARAAKVERVARWVLPAALLIGTLILWDRIVVWNEIPHYILPKPSAVLETLWTDRELLARSLWNTLSTTFMALGVAVLGGVGLAILFTQSKWLDISLSPFAVTLQVTPIIAIAPLIQIYVAEVWLQLLICAWIVAFFPILSNTTLGLKSADTNLRDLMKLYGATRWQTLIHLQIPTALPYFLGGLRIAGGLALIGAIVAEFAAGAAGQGTGLATRIFESAYRLNAARLFASLLLIALTGVLIYALFSLLSHLMLRKWHESALKRDT